jgi:DNA-binding PadR family transcriptional regulator
MSRARTTGLSAGEVVLGLLIERPDHGFGLERRLEERFPAARFAYSTAYSALRRLKKEGLARPVEGGPAAGEEVSWEATPEGVEHFREWVRAPTSTPMQREELHAKISMCEPRELPRLIDMLHAEELACAAELDRIRGRIVAEQSGAGQSGAARRTLADMPWPELMGRGVAHGEAAFWGGRIAQLGRLRAYLERLRGEAERRALDEHRRNLGGERRTA